MPSVGMIRSTRVFVPKSVVKDSNGLNGFRSDSGESNSAKSGGYSDKWFRLLENAGERVDAVHCYKSKSDGYGWDEVVWDRNTFKKDLDENTMLRESVDNNVPSESDDTREDMLFGAVYNRKRRRLAGEKFLSSCHLQEQFPEDAMFGIQYVRRNKRKRPTLLSLEESTDRARTLELNRDEPEVKEHLVPELGVLGREVSLSFIPRVVLAIVVESSFSSVCRFSCFLVSVLSFMRRSRIRLSNLALFMCSELISEVFSLNGIHFSRDPMSKIPGEDDLSSSGICKILGTRQCIPLFLVNFSAIPHSFLSLHSIISLRSQYLPYSFIRFLLIYVPSEAYEVTDSVGLSSISTEVNLSGTSSMVSKSRSLERMVSSNVGANELSGRFAGLHHLKWKRSSLRSVRVRNPRIINLRLHSNGHNLIKANHSVEKVNDTADTDFFGDQDESEQYFSQPNRQHRKSTWKNDIKDLKSLLVELRQNIDSVGCTADILVMEHDKCYKEVGAKVMLQHLESKEWTLGVKRQGLIRHIYKAQFVMRSCTTNRFTHAIIWNSESGWKLEFSNKRDWLIFKELYKECVERNLWAALAKSIPVPTALEVPGYENNIYVPFVRPDAYITAHEDEVTRALMQVANYEMDSDITAHEDEVTRALMQVANYEMDSDDEVWLEKLSNNLYGESSGLQLVSAEKFEEVIDTFEKIAFISPDEAYDEERGSNLCPHMDLGRDIVRTVYQYWQKKRKQKGSALLRVFQHQPSTKPQSPNEPVLEPQASPNKPVLRPRAPPNKPVVRKRRSSKRTSQTEKSKQQNALPAPSVDQTLEDIHRGQQDILRAEEEMRTDQENRQRLKEAIESVSRYSETAVSKRSRAQTLMETADLAVYRAAMALKIAGAIQATRSSETAVSSFF